MLVTINRSRTHLVEMTESVEAQQRLVKGIFRKFTGMKTERFPHVFLIEVKISLIKLISKSPYAQWEVSYQGSLTLITERNNSSSFKQLIWFLKSLDFI